jgi:hypothetical protein
MTPLKIEIVLTKEGWKMIRIQTKNMLMNILPDQRQRSEIFLRTTLLMKKVQKTRAKTEIMLRDFQEVTAELIFVEKVLERIPPEIEIVLIEDGWKEILVKTRAISVNTLPDIKLLLMKTFGAQLIMINALLVTELIRKEVPSQNVLLGTDLGVKLTNL